MNDQEKKFGKYLNQSAKIFSPSTGILDEKDLSRFIYSLKTQNSFSEKLNNIAVLNYAPSTMLDRFVNSKGLLSLIYILKDAYSKKDEKNIEIIDKTLALFKRMTISSKIPNFSDLMKIIIEMRDKEDLPESSFKNLYILTIKWKNEIDEFISRPPPVIEFQIQEEPPRKKDFLQESEQSLKRKRNSSEKEDSLERKRKKNDKYEKKRSSYKDKKDEKKEKKRNSPEKHKKRKKDEKSEVSFQKKKGVNWLAEEKLISTKFFRKGDEPNAAAVSLEEVEIIQKKILAEYIENSNPFYSSDEIKHKESRMEGRSMKMKKESEKEIQEKLNSMKENIMWVKPKKVSLGENSILTKGEHSKEKVAHAKRISTKLVCFYGKENTIPDEPSFKNILNKQSEGKYPREPKRIILNETEADAENFGNLIIETIEIIRKEEESNQFGSVSQSSSHSKKPKKGILKKKKDHSNSDDSKKVENDKKNGKPSEIDTRILQNLIKLLENKDKSIDVKAELEKIIKELRSSGQNVQNILENIRLLKDFISKSQQAQALKQKPEPPKSFIRKASFKPKMEPFLPPMHNLHSGFPFPPKPHLNNIPIPLMGLYPNNNNDQPFLQKPTFVDPNLQLTGNNFDRNNIFMNKDRNRPPGPPPGPPGFLFDDKNLRIDDKMMDPFMNKNMKGNFKPQNYKTVPCRFFHSHVGCPRGDDCHFIHDYNYAGIETPNMHKYVRPLSMLSHSQERNQRNLMIYGGNKNEGEDIGENRGE